MEVPCIYKFQGQKIYIQLLRKLLDIDNNLSVRNETRKRHSELKEKSKNSNVLTVPMYIKTAVRFRVLLSLLLLGIDDNEFPCKYDTNMYNMFERHVIHAFDILFQI